MFWKKVNNTRVVPVNWKIVFVFSLFILLSNLATNYINLIFNRTEQINLMNQLLTKDLKSVYSYCNNQYQIYEFDKNLERSLLSLEKKGLYEIKNRKAVVLGIKPEGELLFQSSKIKKYNIFQDSAVLDKMKKELKNNVDEGNVYFNFNNEEYFGLYRYNAKWNIFILRAEELNEFYAKSRIIFRDVSFIILIVTALIAVIGIFILRFILRYIDIMTSSIMKMVKTQQMELIDMSSATNDDITYLGTAFNSLSSSIDNLIGIFRKFANRDIVVKAYRDGEVKLEGTKRELTVMFTDIKSFTFITETLGNDIIKLLNLHYDRAIREIISNDGVIGSIIGDALLAVFGALEDSYRNKSHQAIAAAYRIHQVTSSLRERMAEVKERLEAENGKLDSMQLKVYKAVLLEVGVGIDGGEVFYGTLGSYVRMTNTVIGDTVNSASRLEGLTRIYKVPVICSEYIREDIESFGEDHGLYFVELDKVQVKGKTEGKTIYWPVPGDIFDNEMQKQVSIFEDALQLYYAGDWGQAHKKFKKCKLSVADEFKQRTAGKCPKNWNGIWEMTTK